MEQPRVRTPLDRTWPEASGVLDPDLYRLRVKDGSGKLLVSYVVEPDVRAVPAWSSPEIPRD